jgi:hypothetical protein
MPPNALTFARCDELFGTNDRSAVRFVEKGDAFKYRFCSVWTLGKTFMYIGARSVCVQVGEPRFYIQDGSIIADVVWSADSAVLVYPAFHRIPRPRDPGNQTKSDRLPSKCLFTRLVLYFVIGDLCHHANVSPSRRP